MNGDAVIVIGASAGGVEALIELAPLLPASLNAVVFVTVHIPSSASSLLPQILSRHGSMLAVHPRDREPLVPGRIYVAPPGLHMIVKPDCIRLTKGPRESGHRPAVDPLFRTAAKAFGARVIGVVLTGTGGDGSAGLAAIKEYGGATIVQHPDDATYPAMPMNAVEHVAPDHVVPLAEIGPLLERLVTERAGVAPGAGPIDTEPDIAEIETPVNTAYAVTNTSSGFICPDCGGALWELEESEMLYFRCRVGHAWSSESLVTMQSSVVENAMWTALRVLEEREVMSRRLADRASDRGRAKTAEYFTNQARTAERSAIVIRSLLGWNGEGMDETLDPITD